MLRTIFSLFLSAAIVTEAAAQTTPATTTTTAKKATTVTTKRAPVKRKASTTVKRTKATSANNTMRPQPAPADAPEVIRRPTGSTATADGKGQGVYAAPGMAVDVTSGKEVGDYRGDAPKPAPKPGNTLSSPATK